MGERRVQLLRRKFPDISIIGVDVEEGRTAMARKKHGIEAYSSLDRVLQTKQCQAAFVCTSPLSHESLIRKILYAKLHVFCELNLKSLSLFGTPKFRGLLDLGPVRALTAGGSKKSSPKVSLISGRSRCQKWILRIKLNFPMWSIFFRV